MHIAYLINQYPKVSHTFIRREITALERLGFTVTRIALRGWDAALVDDQDKAELVRTKYVLKQRKIVLILVLLRLLFTRPKRFVRALTVTLRMSRRAERPLPIHLMYLAEACRIVQWLHAENIEHLHAHFGTNSAEVAMLVNLLGGPPWSFTVHGPEEFDKHSLIGLAEKIRCCAFVVAISSFGRSQLYRMTDYKQWEKINVVRCGIDAAFLEGGNGSVPAVSRIVCVGRLCEQKGQLLLLEAVQKLRGGGHKFELMLVGDGEMRRDAETLIAHFKLNDFVKITGWISNDAVRAEIRAARVFVLPSFAEGLPVVLMEAMALKRPVISTFVGGIPELVEPGKHGWLVPAGDADSLAAALRECLDAPLAVLQKMAEAAHERVVACHDINVEAAKLANLFKTHGKASRLVALSCRYGDTAETQE